MYGKILSSLGAISGDAFVEATGVSLAHEGVDGAKQHLQRIHSANGGVFFIDEAYQLTDQHNPGGRQVLDFLLAEMENNTGRIIFILAGYSKNMETFFEYNRGLTSRVPYTLQFVDYEDADLLLMLQQRIEKRYKGNMKIADGKGGLYMRIIARRLGRGRGRVGFGNARALETTYSRVAECQAERLSRNGSTGIIPDDFFLFK